MFISPLVIDDIKSGFSTMISISRGYNCLFRRHSAPSIVEPLNNAIAGHPPLQKNLWMQLLQLLDIVECW